MNERYIVEPSEQYMNARVMDTKYNVVVCLCRSKEYAVTIAKILNRVWVESVELNSLMKG